VVLAIVSKIRRILARTIPRFDSLSQRLIAAASIWTTIGLLVGGLALSGIFRAHVEDNFDAGLQFDLDSLIAAAEPDAQGYVSLRDRFVNPRFERIFSGWYWQIAQVGGPKEQEQISRSLFDRGLQIQDKKQEGLVTWGHAAGPENQRLRLIERRVEFPVTTGTKRQNRAYIFTVAGDLAEVDASITQFNGTLFWAFLVLGFGLIAAIFVQVRVGLHPLKSVSRALASIRDGKARRLEGNFPAEIAPLASELNSLIEHSAEVVSRARTHVANLAHFLKTPLTVLSNEASASPGPLADVVQRQVDSMRRQVDHYLVRARTAGALDVLGNRTPVKPVLDDLARLLTRMHAARGVTITVDCPASLAFRGDKQDIEEMAGNLMDNACKWAKSAVTVRGAALDGARLLLVVDDDGPGMAPADRDRVMARGERLDESVPGSGLGLSIVRDIAKLYGGFFQLEAASAGGLSARLTLPALA
jgi:signal transduction histidine kinase